MIPPLVEVLQLTAWQIWLRLNITRRRRLSTLIYAAPARSRTSSRSRQRSRVSTPCCVYVAGYSNRTTPATYDDSDELKNALKEALDLIRDGEDDMTPFVALFVAMGPAPKENEWFYTPAHDLWGYRRMEWLTLVQLADNTDKHEDRTKKTVAPIFRCNSPSPPATASAMETDMLLRSRCGRHRCWIGRDTRPGVSLAPPERGRCSERPSERPLCAPTPAVCEIYGPAQSRSRFVALPNTSPGAQILTIRCRGVNRYSQAASCQRRYCWPRDDLP